jgi:hypothetical protein
VGGEHDKTLIGAASSALPPATVYRAILATLYARNFDQRFFAMA